ncbi:unnamed protein product, partial [Nesidiocoris tenuis]
MDGTPQIADQLHVRRTSGIRSGPAALRRQADASQARPRKALEEPVQHRHPDAFAGQAVRLDVVTGSADCRLPLGHVCHRQDDNDIPRCRLLHRLLAAGPEFYRHWHLRLQNSRLEHDQKCRRALLEQLIRS